MFSLWLQPWISTYPSLILTSVMGIQKLTVLEVTTRLFPNLQGKSNNSHCSEAATDINLDVELISRVFALLVHDLGLQALILALKWHIILSKCVQLGKKERKSTSRIYILNLWAWFPESWIKMIWNEKKRVDVSNHSNKVI